MSRLTPFRSLIQSAMAGILLAYGIVWLLNMNSFRGPESYVRRTDFVATLTGAQMIRDGQGEQLYELPAQHAAQVALMLPYWRLPVDWTMPFNHPPMEAFAVLPVMGLPLSVVYLLWTTLSIAALVLAAVLMQQVRPLPRSWLLLLALGAASFHPTARALLLGQNTCFVLLGLVLCYWATRRRLPPLAAAGLVLVGLKPQFLPVLLLALLILGEWRTVALFGALEGLLFLGFVPWLGWVWPVQYVQLLRTLSTWHDTVIDPSVMLNWRGFTFQLLGSDGASSWLPLSVASVLTVALAAWHVRSCPVACRQGAEDCVWSLAVLVALLGSMHLNSHDLALLIFPAWLVVVELVAGRLAGSVARAWQVVLGGYYAVSQLILFYQGTVIAGVCLMAAACLLLLYRTWQLTSPTPPARRVSPEAEMASTTPI